MGIKRNLAIISLIWMLLVAASFAWNYRNARDEQKRISLQSARSFFDQILITRKWNARHGGVFVPVNETTRPNPYLNNVGRDIKVDDSLTLTKVNPAFMTRQISEIAQEQGGIQFHITSLKPIRPANMPTERERAALLAFEGGVKEVGEFIGNGPEKGFFYMAPLITGKECLKCHARQGYVEGDIRGGLSVTLPFVMDIPLQSLGLGHFVIWLVGLGGIVGLGLKLNAAYEIIKNQAVLDSLTGIPNRRSFSESLLREFKLSQRNHNVFAVLMIDIDNFKKFNDTYGHVAGDECLIKVAAEIKKSLLRPGDFCARYGGEEFVVILSDTPLAGGEYVAERIRHNIEKLQIPHVSAPHKIVTLSLGVVALTDGVFTHEELVKHADLALYRAKENGRNRVECQPLDPGEPL